MYLNISCVRLRIVQHFVAKVLRRRLVAVFRLGIRLKTRERVVRSKMEKYEIMSIALGRVDNSCCSCLDLGIPRACGRFLVRGMSIPSGVEVPAKVYG